MIRRIVVLTVMLVAALVASSAGAAPGDLRRVGPDGRFTDLHSKVDSSDWRRGFAFNSTDEEYLLVWRDMLSTEGAIFGQRLSTAGDRIARSFPISPPTAGTPGHPAVAYNPVDNEFLVVWEDSRNGENVLSTDIFGQRLRANGARVGKSFRVSGADAIGRDSYPAVAHNPIDNEFLVAWGNEPDAAASEGDIYSRRLANDGAKLGSIRRISGKNAETVLYPAVAHNRADNQYLVVWSSRRDTEPGSRIHASLVASDNTRINNIFRVSGIKNGNALLPQAAHSIVSNEYLVVWWDSLWGEGWDYRVIGRRLAANGQRLGAARRVTGTNADGYYGPALAYSEGAGGYLIGWDDDRHDHANDGRTGIFGQQLDEQAQKVGSNFRLSGPSAFQSGPPVIAANLATNEYLVAWKDWRIAEEWGDHIYGQRVARRTP